jgi:cofilin
MIFSRKEIKLLSRHCIAKLILINPEKMAATGVSVADAVVMEFNEMKLGRVPARYIIYRIDGPLIVTAVVGATTETFADFVAKLPEDDCRYAIYDMNFTTTDGRPGNKLVSITW